MLHFVANLSEDASSSASDDSGNDTSDNVSGDHDTSADVSSGDIEDSSKKIGNQEVLFSIKIE